MLKLKHCSFELGFSAGIVKYLENLDTITLEQSNIQLALILNFWNANINPFS